MKSNFKSVFIAVAFQAVLGLSLTGCSESNGMPHVFGGTEVPPDVLAQPRVVSAPSQEALSTPNWPRLADVPSKPQSFTPQPAIDEAKKEMEQDRTQANKTQQEYESPYLQSSPSSYPLTPPQLPQR